MKNNKSNIVVNIFQVASCIFVIWIFAIVTVPFKGKNYCRSYLVENDKDFFNSAIEVDFITTRTLDNHWITALLMQPKDINKSEFTIVCHFKSTTYNVDGANFYQGNKIERLKLVSTSNFSPKTFFR